MVKQQIDASKIIPDGYCPIINGLKDFKNDQMIGMEVKVYGRYPKSSSEPLKFLHTGTILKIDRKGDDEDPFNFNLFSNTVVTVKTDSGLEKDFTVRMLLLKYNGKYSIR